MRQPLLLRDSISRGVHLTLPHILVVEDSPLVVAALRLLLEETGYRVSAAGTVDEALVICRGDRPDAMLLDLTLPDGDGLLVISTLRGEQTPPPITAAMTGHSDPDTVARCLEAGCREVLQKPVPVKELIEKIRGWVG